MTLQAKRPTQTKTFGGKRYTLDMCFPTKREANQDTAQWRKRGYLARVVTLSGEGLIPVVKHHCVYYRWPK